jgi:hypothetical protein
MLHQLKNADTSSLDSTENKSTVPPAHAIPPQFPLEPSNTSASATVMVTEIANYDDLVRTLPTREVLKIAMQFINLYEELAESFGVKIADVGRMGEQFDASNTSVNEVPMGDVAHRRDPNSFVVGLFGLEEANATTTVTSTNIDNMDEANENSSESRKLAAMRAAEFCLALKDRVSKTQKLNSKIEIRTSLSSGTLYSSSTITKIPDSKESEYPESTVFNVWGNTVRSAFAVLERARQAENEKGVVNEKNSTSTFSKNQILMAESTYLVFHKNHDHHFKILMAEKIPNSMENGRVVKAYVLEGRTL